MNAGAERLGQDQARAARVPGRRHDDDAPETSLADVARDRPRLAHRAEGAAGERVNRRLRDAQPDEGLLRQLVVLRQPDAACPQGGRAACQALAGEQNQRCASLLVESRRLQHPIGHRAGEHDDGVGMRRQRIRHDELAPGAAKRQHGRGGEDDGGDQDRQGPQAHAGRTLRTRAALRNRQA